MIKLLIGIAIIAFFLTSIPQTAVRVIDGDTIAIGDQRVRLSCIDAPESDQPYGIEAKEELEKIIGNRTVTVSVESTDRYGRDIGWVILDGKDTANVEMIKRGYAWWYEYYCEDYLRLGQLQRHARYYKIGLWKEVAPIDPYSWRKNH